MFAQKKIKERRKKSVYIHNQAKEKKRNNFLNQFTYCLKLVVLCILFLFLVGLENRGGFGVSLPLSLALCVCVCLCCVCFYKWRPRSTHSSMLFIPSQRAVMGVFRLVPFVVSLLKSLLHENHVNKISLRFPCSFTQIHICVCVCDKIKRHFFVCFVLFHTFIVYTHVCVLPLPRWFPFFRSCIFFLLSVFYQTLKLIRIIHTRFT